ncbi:hypothetical protein NM208_g3874 [Fusarium decemcellulare]|uniref:Uncharacterized protein n=1 Tax=Fusarium decemcellulare TaxID=57161 RepID=A0ACC1SMN3_9HYPO|nr:hypothetical protein NM208_g3874 [Fusarium decemcellulare]
MTNSSTRYAPWTLLVSNDSSSNNLTNLFAPAWVNSPQARGTLDILQNCIFTLIACIYTSMHLDVVYKKPESRFPRDKVKWTILRLFAPEMALIIAAKQLREAWKLRSSLRKIRAASGRADESVDIDLTYAFFILMGGVRIDVDNFMSEPDLDPVGYNDMPPDFRNKFKNRPISVRLSSGTVKWLAERGHWINISNKTISDKSKADGFQKIPVYGLPFTLLEVHTMVHVVCGVVLYVCWLKKPLNVQEPVIRKPEGFEGEIAVLIQKQFYSWTWNNLVIFPPRQYPAQPPPHQRLYPRYHMRWVMPYPGLRMTEGDILPFGLALYSPITYPYTSVDETLAVTDQFLCRWNAILNTFPLDNPDELSKSSQFCTKAEGSQHQIYINSMPLAARGDDLVHGCFLAPLQKPKHRPKLAMNQKYNWGMPFPRDDNAIDTKVTGLRELMLLSVASSAMYTGAHLLAWNWAFPTSTEKLLWKFSCLYIISCLPILLAPLWVLHNSETLWIMYCALAGVIILVVPYIAARVFITVEAFISLRQAPIGLSIFVPSTLSSNPSPCPENHVKSERKEALGVCYRADKRPEGIPTFWDATFNPHMPVGWQYENKPFLQLWKDSGSEISWIRFFMTESGAENRLMPEVELVAGFCPDKTLNELEDGSSSVPQATIALLDDRTNDGTNSIPRGYLGPLNAHKLYQELKKDVKLPRRGSAVWFITDLDRWSMMALVSTLSIHQAMALRGSLYRHLTFRGFLGSTYPFSGVWTFQLAFDLPYYAFRVAPCHSPPRDPRKRKSAASDTLRNITDLSFLVRKPKSPVPPTAKAYLCEVQTTVLISGSDPWRWVAYCFVDTYFESEDRRESVDAYHEDVEIDEDSHVQIQPDPFTTAESDANLPVLDPRQYFLIVLESRLRQARDEWHTLATNMGAIINEYLDSFKSDETFATLAGRALRFISEIGNHTKRLRGSLEDLENLCKACDDYADDLSFYLSHEGTRDAKTQAQMASFAQNMTFLIVGLLSPIAVAAGVLSMHQQAIPAPLGPNARSFFGLIIILMVAVWSAIGIMVHWRRISQLITKLFKTILTGDIDLERQQG